MSAALAIEIMKAVGVYEEARRLVDSDAHLAELFENDFKKLIQVAKK